MPILLDDQQPDLFVPDLTKPAGAAVASDGTVACVACRQRVALAAADVVGQGYRCAPCSHRAAVAGLGGGSDVGDHLDGEARNGMRRSGQQILAGGLGLIVLGAILVPSLASPNLGFAGMMFGLMLASFGYSRMRASR